LKVAEVLVSPGRDASLGDALSGRVIPSEPMGCLIKANQTSRAS